MKKLTATFLSLALLISVGTFTGTALAAESQTITKVGSQPSFKGSVDYFTGNVLVDPLFPANNLTNFGGALRLASFSIPDSTLPSIISPFE